MEKYDCTNDVLAHKALVAEKINNVIAQLHDRALHHDDSKLVEPEKSMFDEWTPKLKEYSVSSEEYEEARKHMGDNLKKHYKNNRHHPEHFEYGIEEMTLIDVIEMFCDWQAATQQRGEPMDLAYLSERFHLMDENLLYNIFWNTLHES